MARATDDRWVLLPGTLCTPEVFAPVLDYLGVAADKRHVVEVDKPHVEDYAALLRAQVADGAVVCGFSLGAMVLAHNLDALARARAVVLLACNPFPDPKANRANREALRDRVLAGGARDWVRESWQAMSAAPNPELREHVAAMADTTSHLIAAQTELAVSRPGAADQLAASPHTGNPPKAGRARPFRVARSAQAGGQCHHRRAKCTAPFLQHRKLSL